MLMANATAVAAHPDNEVKNVETIIEPGMIT